MENISGMTIFVRTIEARGLTGAARRSGISVSAVSKALNRLEKRLGVQLIYRSARSLSLTDSGARYYESCRRILADIEAAEASVTETLERAQGQLRINLPVAFGRLHVVPLLGEYMVRNPAVTLDLTFTDEFTDLIAEGVDLAVRMSRNKPPDTRLITRGVASSYLVICGSPEYPKQRGEPRSPDDLRDYNCLNFSHSGRPYGYRLNVDGRRTDVPVLGRLRTNNGEALRDAVLGGIGLAQLHSYIAGPEIQAGRLRTVLRNYISQGIPISVVYPRQRVVPPAARALIKLLVENLREPVPWHAFLRDK
jgi:DNA-binding transcriptional LysR family regulator